jgi:hypothetical protein
MSLIMKDDYLIEYINTVCWDDIKDLPETNSRVYLNEELESQDREIENSSYEYLTIFDVAREDGKDRYFCSSTNSKFKSFMSGDYKGSPDKHKDIFQESLSKYEHRVICLKIGDDESKILIEEEVVLDGVDAKDNIKFFNASNISGGLLKSLGNQQELFDSVIESIEKTNRGEESDFEVGEENVHVLYKMERAQPRSGDLDDSHVNDIEKDILGSYGKALKNIRKTILMQNYYGPGIHKRGGNTHTLEACVRSSLENYVDKIGYVFWPESSWRKCSAHTIRDVLLWDNAREEEISRKYTNLDEIIQSCFDFMKDFKLTEHTDHRVKGRAKALGMRPSEWSGASGVRVKLKNLMDKKSTDGFVPEGMDIIKYTTSKIEAHEKEKSTSNLDVKVLTTIYAGGNTFSGWDYIVRWLHDPKNKRRRLHGDFMHGMEGIQRYVDAWPAKQLDIVPLIEKMFADYVISIDKKGNKITKKGHFTWDMMDRFETKKNKIHDQKAA